MAGGEKDASSSENMSPMEQQLKAFIEQSNTRIEIMEEWQKQQDANMKALVRQMEKGAMIPTEERRTDLGIAQGDSYDGAYSSVGGGYRSVSSMTTPVLSSFSHGLPAPVSGHSHPSRFGPLPSIMNPNVSPIPSSNNPIQPVFTHNTTLTTYPTVPNTNLNPYPSPTSTPNPPPLSRVNMNNPAYICVSLPTQHTTYGNPLMFGNFAYQNQNTTAYSTTTTPSLPRPNTSTSYAYGPTNQNIFIPPNPVNINPANNQPKVKLNFPEFDGTNPRGWLRRCERFFDIYRIDEGKS